MGNILYKKNKSKEICTCCNDKKWIYCSKCGGSGCFTAYCQDCNDGYKLQYGKCINKKCQSGMINTFCTCYKGRIMCPECYKGK
ncbi:MAG: hypothetical protein Edafosvirus6_27 [Edafosvirus sp.]|uniref:Uncharacterized protein n=1 Tax=Edafosvirus sp. TaxID=2487765 RepID=A0A3G4ZTG3_9VIRU|nr:MAG: hypothetical protein Edafosvirus6_27 [Edafosvirus sp.]